MNTLVTVIVVCEIAFWVVLATGLLARYLLRRRRLGAVVLACVPLVDLVLLGATVLDLSRGARAEAAHGLADAYLGFSVAFGASLVRWADERFAHRFAGGPAPGAHRATAARGRATSGRSSAKRCSPGPSAADCCSSAIAFVGDADRPRRCRRGSRA